MSSSSIFISENILKQDKMGRVMEIWADVNKYWVLVAPYITIDDDCK